MSFFSHKKNQIWLGIVSCLMLIDLYFILFVTPIHPEQQWAQRIFYFHVPTAWTGFLAYFLVMIGGILFLWKKDQKWDNFGLASAEIGTLFTALVLVTGPIWAKPVWGHAWTWEPRLTTTLILFLIFVGYFMLRAYGGHPERVSRYAAALGIIAFADVPIIFISVKFWLPEFQSHPQVEMNKQAPEYLYPFLFSLFVFTMIYLIMLRYRMHILNLKNKALSE